MKFTNAWANVISQNITLRLVVGVLTLCSLFFCIALARLSVREPLVIERGCFSNVAAPSSGKHTDLEIENFLREAVPMRFDSKAADFRAFLSDDELVFRIKEQEELSKKGMTQKVIVNGTKIEKDTFTIDADRLFSIGKVRSALPFPLAVDLRSVNRTASNPYGLILKRVMPITDKEEAK